MGLSLQQIIMWQILSAPKFCYHFYQIHSFNILCSELQITSLNKPETEGKLLPLTNDSHKKLKPSSALSINRVAAALCV